MRSGVAPSATSPGLCACRSDRGGAPRRAGPPLRHRRPRRAARAGPRQRNRQAAAREALEPRIRGPAPHRRGQSLKQIAALLDVNPKTVSTFRARVLEKLALKTNADLVRYALQHKLI